MKHTLPKTLPSNWLASAKRESSDGCYESFIVVRASAEKNAYDPFMVHVAYYKDEGEQKGRGGEGRAPERGREHPAIVKAWGSAGQTGGAGPAVFAPRPLP